MKRQLIWIAWPPRALALHIFAQCVYVVLVFNFEALPREFWNLGLIILMCLGIDCALRFAFDRQRNLLIFNFVAWGIANSTFINSETYSTIGLLTCGLIAITSKFFIVDREGRHLFNPSIFGIVAGTVLFPFSVSYGAQTFGDFWPVNLIVVLVGGVAVFAANSWVIVLTYKIGFILLSILTQALLLHFNLVAVWEKAAVGPGFWAVSQLSLGSLIFAFGVISDPQTSPRRRRDQIWFGLGIATLDFVLRKNLVLMPDAFAYLFMQATWSLVRNYRPVELRSRTFV